MVGNSGTAGNIFIRSVKEHGQTWHILGILGPHRFGDTTSFCTVYKRQKRPHNLIKPN